MQYDTCAFFHDCLLFALLPVYKLAGLQHKVCLTPSVALLQPLVNLRLAESNALSLLVKGNEVSTRPSIDRLFCRMAWKIITKSFEVEPLIFLFFIRRNCEIVNLALNGLQLLCDGCQHFWHGIKGNSRFVHHIIFILNSFLCEAFSRL